MPASRICNRVNYIVNRNMDDRTAGFRIQLADEAKEHVFSLTRSAIAVTLSDVAVSNIVDEVWSDGPRIAGGDALRVVNQTRGWKLSWKLQSASLGILLQIAAN